jgi:hypothetical protein
MSRVIEPPATTETRKRHRKLWLILALLVLPPLMFAAYIWAALHYSYSSGERAGYVQKISRKGWVCKTWEGELVMAAIPGVMPEIFRFSVRDDATAHQIEQAAGNRVALAYQQHKGVPTSCFGETEYFVTGVRTIGR